MSNSWLRLWHDMPNDPKWRTIARISGEPVSLVQAIYIHLLVDASRNVTRGHVTIVTEDIASALDVTEEQVDSVLNAMQGRVLDGGMVSGWAKRQPKNEDAGNAETGSKSATQRQRECRERKRAIAENSACHEMSRNVTTDTDKDTENIKTLLSEPDDSDICAAENKADEIAESANVVPIRPAKPEIPYQAIVDAYHEALPELPSVAILSDSRKRLIKARWLDVLKSKRQNGTRRYTDVVTGVEWWTSFFQNVRHNPHWMGNNDRGWTATFDWLLNANNVHKVIEFCPRASA